MTKILLVEDDRSLREIYDIRLRAEGYIIVSAGDGEEALALAIQEKPDLIISDVMMPKISGFDMLDILRSTPETRNIRVIIMTALSNEDQRQRGEALGADYYLVKSQVGIEDVINVVHSILNDKPGATASQPGVVNNTTEGPSSTPQSSTDQSVPVQDDQTPEQVAPTSPVVPEQSTQETAQQVQSASTGPVAIAQTEDLGGDVSNSVAIDPPAQTQSPGIPQPIAPFASPTPPNRGAAVIDSVASGPQGTVDSTSKSQQDGSVPGATDGQVAAESPVQNSTAASSTTNAVPVPVTDPQGQQPMQNFDPQTSSQV